MRQRGKSYWLACLNATGLAASMCMLNPALADSVAQPQNSSATEEVKVWGQSSQLSQQSPSIRLNTRDFAGINATTFEDLVKYVPSFTVRQRYVGDAGGTAGMRGSNMFQTPRTMVFVDGVPVHYHLQTRWSGAPRWSMVAASEVETVEVLYGPFSSQYSGAAMAGVINIETRLPTEREVVVQASAMQQDFDAYGFDQSLHGHKMFASYANAWNGFTLYSSLNLLQNESQPQIFRTSAYSSDTDGASPTAVSGAKFGVNEYGQPTVYFADAGSEKVDSVYAKVKLAYDTEQWQSMVNLVGESRSLDQTHVNNYLRSVGMSVGMSAGEPVWNGQVEQDGRVFSVASGNFAPASSERESLTLGARVQGQLSAAWQLSLDASAFENLRDETTEWPIHPSDPAYTGETLVSQFDDLGWQRAQAMLDYQGAVGKQATALRFGLQTERAQLRQKNVSGGETQLNAAFVQGDWGDASQWLLSVGLRYDAWQSRDGFYADGEHPDRDEHALSPKLALSYGGFDSLQLRYAYAQAYRFPIVEELFQNQRRARQYSVANIDLAPEHGEHHNLSLQYDIPSGFLRWNLFYEQVQDAIDAQTKIVDNVAINTFLPIDQVTTHGLEWVMQTRNLAGLALDLQANLTYARSVISENPQGNADYIDKDFPRMPRWRGNLLATYYPAPRWHLGVGLRYASNSYGDADNGDTESRVFGAFDPYLFVNTKLGYQLNEHTKFSVGVDNLADQRRYVHHPWPGRTLFVSASVRY